MQKKHIIIAIVALALVLRFWNLGLGDPLTDEVLYAFRSVGLLDFSEAEFQTTPLEWLDPDIPFWTKFSFHDHPPLVMWVQHFFMRLFGENTFAFRLPSALIGILSVYFLYLLGRRLFSENTALIAAAIFAVTVNHVYISRLGMQEAYVIFFLLLTLYFFIRGFERNVFFIWFGVALGCALLSKYTTFVLLPIIFTYLLLFKRDYLFNKRLWLGIVIAIILFSPVIIYNIKLFQAVGHFDFQFSYIFNQKPAVWQITPGKEMGGITDRIMQFIPNLVATHSWLLLLLFIIAIPFFITRFFKEKNRNLASIGFLGITIIYILLLLILIGPSSRFLTLLTPFIVLIIAIEIIRLFNAKKVTLYALISIIIVFEIIYSINSLMLDYPKGKEVMAYSKVCNDTYQWGYNELGKFLQEELENKMPELALEMQYAFLNDLHTEALERGKDKNLEPHPLLIIYDENIYNIPQLWFLERLNIYHAWPVMKIGTFLKAREKNGNDFFDELGFEHYYVIIPARDILLKPVEKQTKSGSILEKELQSQGITAKTLYNKRGEDAFYVYMFGSEDF